MYELDPNFSVFPTFPINLAFKQTSQDVFDFIKRTTSAAVPGVPPFDAQRSVDGERGIEIVRPIPVGSDDLDLEVQSKVIGVYDKSMYFTPIFSQMYMSLTHHRREHGT